MQSPFLSPLSLLFLLAVPAVVLLYLLRLRRREVVVSSTILWPDMIQDMQANTPFQKLRKNLLMFLQIAIIMLMAFALARPFLQWHAKTSDNTVIVVDASASMQSMDERGGRIEAAKRAATKMVEDMSRSDRAMVIAAGSKPKVLSAVTTDKRVLKGAIRDLEPCDGQADMRSAVVLGVSLMEAEQRGLRAAEKSDVFILSDGAFEPLEDLPVAAGLHFMKFGQRSDNVAITALDARRTYGATVKDQILISVTNFSDETKNVDLELYHWDSLQRVTELTIPPEETRSDIWEGFEFDRGVVKARLDIDDDLAVDNEAYAYLAPRRHLNVLLVSEDNIFLEKVLNVKDVVDLATVKPGGFVSSEGYDIVVFDSFAPERLTAGAYLLVNTGAPGGPVDILGRVPRPSVVDTQPHPVTKYVNFASIGITGAKLAEAKPWGKVLVEAASTPLVVAGERGDIKCVYIGFPLKPPPDGTSPGTNFILLPGFPIFMSNVVEWLARGGTGTENIQTRAGSVAQLQAAETGTELEVVKPSGKTVSVVAPEGESTVPFDDTDEVGVYKAGTGEDQQVFVVNLLSRAESNTAPRENISFGSRSLEARSGGGTSNREIWRLLALLGLVALMVEWYIYHRRL